MPIPRASTFPIRALAPVTVELALALACKFTPVTFTLATETSAPVLLAFAEHFAFFSINFKSAVAALMLAPVADALASAL